MIRYGALLPSGDDREIRFFRTSREIEAGTYAGREGERIQIAEISAALLMAIYPDIERMQRRGQDDLRSPGLEAEAGDRMAQRLTDELARRLAEDDGVWEDEPSWLDDVRPLS